MQEEKLEQLKVVFEALLRKFKVAILMRDVGFSGYTKQDPIINGYTNAFLKEVKIRIKNK